MCTCMWSPDVDKITIYNQIRVQLSAYWIRISLHILAFPPVGSGHMMAALICANGGEQLALYVIPEMCVCHCVMNQLV